LTSEIERIGVIDPRHQVAVAQVVGDVLPTSSEVTGRTGDSRMS
jgi:hypothetical protein